MITIALAAALLLTSAAGTVWWTKHSSQGGRAPLAADDARTTAIVDIDGVTENNVIAGTGMLIGSDGIVLTNDHVVAGTTFLSVRLTTNGQLFRAIVVGADPTQDVAVLRLQDASGLPTVSFDASGSLSIGETVTALGNALGRNGAPVAASGQLTSLDQTVIVANDLGGSDETLQGLVCFSAHIQPGDSGGPLLNRAGRVIGMDTAGTLTDAMKAQLGWGCAIPITAAMTIAHEILSGASSPFIQPG